jgi:hypothetical protein
VNRARNRLAGMLGLSELEAGQASETLDIITTA